MKRDIGRPTFLIVMLLAFLGAISPAIAQDTQTPAAPIQAEIGQWNDKAANARSLVEESLSETSAQQLDKLEAVRSELAAQRDQALALSRVQPFEAVVAQGKLDLLGSIPEGGESDFAAAKRAELEEEVYRLQAPQRAYTDSYLRTVATIALVDDRIDELLEDQLLTRGQTPLLPRSWTAFFAELPERFRATFAGASQPADVEEGSRPAILVFVTIGMILGLGIATLGRAKLTDRLARAYSSLMEVAPGKAALIAIVRDVAGLVVAAMGIMIMVMATVLLAGIYPQFESLPLIILAVGLTILIASWLGETIFSPNRKEFQFVELRDKGAKRAALFMLALGAALGLETLLERIEEVVPFSPAASGIGPFIVMIAVSLSLYGLARTIEIFRRPQKSETLDESLDKDEQFLNEKIDWARLLTMAMKFSAIASAALAIIGFGALARFAILPTIESLAVIAVLSVVYLRLVTLVAHLPALDLAESGNAFLAAKVILFFLFAAVATPLIAIFWGVRPAEVADLMILLRDGITIGGTTISLGTVFVFFAVFALGYVITRWVQRALQTMLLSRLDMDDGTKSAIVTGTGYIGVVIAFVAAIGAAGIDLSNLAIIFGALSVGIGFGMQSIVSNFVSGIIMLVERPIKEGDSIEVGGYAGIVDKISVRATRIQSFDHDDVIIPNSELIAGTVRNRTLTDRFTRIECSVGIAYDADVHKAFDILYDVAKSHENAMTDPPPNVVMEQLGDSALMLRLYCFVDEVGLGLKVRSHMYMEIVRRFAEAGISIPFPQRDINLKPPANGRDENG